MAHHVFPHSDFAEDERYGKSVLTTHVLRRGWQTGATIGLGIGTAQSLLKRKAFSTILAPTGLGAIVGMALMVPGLPFYMLGKEDIEWKDRSWRLLEHRGQKEVDDWSAVGLVGGALAAARSPAVREAGKLSLVRLAGGAAVGDLIGVVGYMVGARCIGDSSVDHVLILDNIRIGVEVWYQWWKVPRSGLRKT